MERHSWAGSTVVSVLLLVLIEAYALAQKEWLASYRSLDLYLFLQIIEVAVAIACYQTLARSQIDRQLVLLSRAVNAICVVYGLKILVIVAVDTAECSALDGKDRDEAEKCIDIYKNYAAIQNGDSTSSCASLNVNTETLLGGVCPTVYLGHSTGVVVLAFEIVVAVAFLALNMSKISMGGSYLYDVDSDSDWARYGDWTKQQGGTASKIGAKKNETKKKSPEKKTNKSGGPVRTPMSSIYGGH